MLSAYGVLNKAKGLWGEIIDLHAKIELEQPKRELLAHAEDAKARIEVIMDELEKLQESQLRG
jgi:hypothetical protein